MIRNGSEWRRVSWNEARAFVAERLPDADRCATGRTASASSGSARATNEDNYLAQKLARAVIGTNNVDCCARVCHAPSAAALKRAFGAGLATNSFDDIEIARTILVCGANATEDHPVVGARIKQAALSRRSPDRHRSATDRAGDSTPTATSPCDRARTSRCSTPWRTRSSPKASATVPSSSVASLPSPSSRHSSQSWTPERAASMCGVEAETIRQAARLYASESPAMSVHGLGLTEHVQGTDGVTTLINLALLTGNVGKPGSGYQSAARPEQRAGRGAHGLRSSCAARIRPS